MLKGISMRQLPTHTKLGPELQGKLTAEFMCPRLHFSLPTKPNVLSSEKVQYAPRKPRPDPTDILSTWM